MASIRINILANLVGKVWAAGIVLILIPFYIRYLGMESYGLVGFYATLIGSMAILDMGLSTTLNRQLARFRSGESSRNEIRDLSFSLECIYWGIGFFIALLVIALSGPIATHWVRTEELPADVVKKSVMLMGAVIAFQWPISLYSGGLTGLEKQVTNNVVNVVMSTLRGAGVLLVFEFVSASLEAFFIWQASLSFLYVATLRIVFWKYMPRSTRRPAFSSAQVKLIWRFAVGMTGISAVSFLLSQIDKILLSKWLLLKDFGHYMLAFTLASSITLIVVPISTAFFPRFAGLFKLNSEEQLRQLYHKACRLMAVFIFPVGLVMIFFTREILMAWTKSAETADQTYLLARILAIGSVCNALMVIPYNLMIASGWTRFTLYQNTIAAVILVPLLFVWTNLYGAVGATFVWVAVNAGYIFISQPMMHRRLLKNELATWYLHDTLLPLLPPLIVTLSARLLFDYLLPGTTVNIFLLGIISLLAFSVSVLTMTETRTILKNKLKLT